MRVTALFVVVGCLAAGCQQCNDIIDPIDDDAGGLTCMRNEDCTGDDICAGGQCRPPGSIMEGGMCSATRDCADMLNCSELGVCVSAGDGAAGTTCMSAADCAHGLACIFDGFGGTCTMPGSTDLGGTCTSTSMCIAGLACGNDDTCVPTPTAYPPWAGVSCLPDTAMFSSYFSVPRGGAALPDFYQLPFPNDIRVRANGTLDLTSFPRPGKSLLGVDVVDLYADALDEDFEGFSSVAPVMFRFTKELEFDSLGTNGANIKLVDITPSTPEFGQELGRGWSYGAGRRKFHCQQALILGPSRTSPLLPGHTYAAFVTTAIRSKQNEAPTVPPDLAAVIGATQPADPDLAIAWTKYTSFRAYLTANTIDPATIAGLAVYTVADSTKRARELAAAVAASALPAPTNLTLCDGVAVSPCAGEDGRACGDSAGAFWEIHGKYTEPNFQAGTLPYATPADGGGITYTGTTPVQNGTTEVCFALTIPKTAAPANGYPLVVHAHGTGGSFKSAVSGGIAAQLATASTPTATLTFDGVVHGARKMGSTRSTDSLVFNVINPRAARDNHLQGAVDVIQALRFAQIADTTVGAATIALDPTKVYYFGHSQGGNVGIPAIAVSAVTTGALFSGAGSDLTVGILNKTSPVNAKAGLEFLLGDPLAGGHPVMVLWQTFFDRIDPINFAPLLVTRPPAGVASKHVMMTWSATDTYSPKDTLNATAKSARLLVATPVIEDQMTGTDARPVTPNRTAGDAVVRFATVFQYATDGTYDGHFVAQNNPQAKMDWTAFFMSLIAGAPNVP
ncbi:MAG: alpha/beta hydrolase family protein [Kofleriaceae bacterium]